jgi:serpin B
MNQQQSNPKSSFQLRRCAIRLGRRYALSAASVVMLGFSMAGYSKLNTSTVLFTTPSSSLEQQWRDRL